MSSSTSKPQLFFSYTADEKPLAQALIGALRTHLDGVEVFDWDPQNNIGTDWADKIRAQLEVSDAIVSLLSPDSIRKHWILFEWGAAWFHSKRALIPVFHSGLDPKRDLGPPLSSINGLSVDAPEFATDFLNSVKDALSAKLTKAPNEASFRKEIEDAVSDIRKRRDRIDLFIAMPLADAGWFDIETKGLAKLFGAAVLSPDDARRLRREIEEGVAEAVTELKNQGLKVRYAGLDQFHGDDRERKVREGVQALRMANEFALILTTMRATGALCEAGFAHALGIKSTYYVREGLSAPTFLSVSKTDSDKFSDGKELKRKLLAKFGKPTL